jgi:hypothetical protein
VDNKNYVYLRHYPENVLNSWTLYVGTIRSIRLMDGGREHIEHGRRILLFEGDNYPAYANPFVRKSNIFTSMMRMM